MADGKLKVLMLGWEFPPHISGGLGTACLGLTQALTEWPIEIHFLLPKMYGQEFANHLNLYSVSQSLVKRKHFTNMEFFESSTTDTHEKIHSEIRNKDFEMILHSIPSYLTPYLRPESRTMYSQKLDGSFFNVTFKELISQLRQTKIVKEHHSWKDETERSTPLTQGTSTHYGDRLFDEVKNYAMRALHLAQGIEFDIIHAHDWMTYPAAMAIAQNHSKPAVLHVHSLESDRSGLHRNPFIEEIERNSLQAVDAIITVSDYTKQRVCQDYGIDRDKIAVVHNGVMSNKLQPTFRPQLDNKKKQRVLFLGRVTFQKGPDYFIEAALRVLKILPDTEFVLAGSGDMLNGLREKVRAAGAASQFIFPGFLKGAQVDDMFSTADLYVMPSVSEPFGISALEALDNNVPIIVSRQSGVSEVIRHALKADFWDIDELTDLMIGALKYPDLRMDLLDMAKKEVEKLDWKTSAYKVLNVYQNVLTNRSH